jgi:hypothetical protein
MGPRIIGAGVGRTGTYSLRTALNTLGMGPCHHMEEVLHHMPVQLPLWQAAVAGRADWPAVYKGYESTVDWPTAGFVPELYKAFPDAKFILTVRSPESWAASFSETIYALCAGKDEAPPHMQAWLEMAIAIIDRTGFPAGLDRDQLAKAFTKHNEAVKALIPAGQLLVYEVKDGWEPLCRFLGKPVPEDAFPRTNDRAEFWELVKRGSKAA